MVGHPNFLLLARHRNDSAFLLIDPLAVQPYILLRQQM